VLDGRDLLDELLDRNYDQKSGTPCFLENGACALSRDGGGVREVSEPGRTRALGIGGPVRATSSSTAGRAQGARDGPRLSISLLLWCLCAGLLPAVMDPRLSV